MNTKYKVGDQVQLENGGQLRIDTIKINKHGIYYYTQANNVMWREDQIKGLWGAGAKDTTYTAKRSKNAPKTESNNN